jgi:hypothetical protein
MYFKCVHVLVSAVALDVCSSYAHTVLGCIVLTCNQISLIV